MTVATAPARLSVISDGAVLVLDAEVPVCLLPSIYLADQAAFKGAMPLRLDKRLTSNSLSQKRPVLGLVTR